MSRFTAVKLSARVVLLVFCLAAVGPIASHGQGRANVQELKRKASELVKQQKYVEALPILEELSRAEPDDPETHFHLAFALIAQANVTKDDATRNSLLARAHNAFVKSKELGIKEPVVDALIQSTSVGESESRIYSQNAEANKLFVEAEEFFSRGDLDEALTNYKKALQLDPKLYEAAVFSGDVYVQKDDFAQAEAWYQKAIAINPNREIAYRYSATPLMKQGKYSQARDRYVEAYISEPYNSFSVAGLKQWAQITNAKIGHPEIIVPADVTFDEKGDAKIDLSSSALLGGKEDGSFAWISYGAIRSNWRKERFAKMFPQERTYRHSLAEEADALRAVLAVASGDSKLKSLNPSLMRLKKLNDDGLLEAYILLARADGGISEDHPAYLRQNRDRLRRYVVEYLLSGGER